MRLPMHRRTMMKGILSVTTKGHQIPDAELKEGKKLPSFMENNEYKPPHCYNKPFEDPDRFYNGQTYVMLNEHGTIFRFSKAKSLFFLDRSCKLRQGAINVFTSPYFTHFITFVILCNCAFMALVDPPAWIEDYLEYVFMAIYIVEAAIKIVARGFLLHRFSYLRDPWNWIDFVIIVIAIITEVLKAASAQGMFSKVAVLKAFRVLRALKTMSIVPGLRAIVKALLRSIRALKDAVLLTTFCVAVFGLVGYQLFHGTMRQKCVRVGGAFDLPPDALFLDQSANQTLTMTESNATDRILATPKLIRIFPDYNDDACLDSSETSAGIEPIAGDVGRILSAVTNQTIGMFADVERNQTCLRDSTVAVNLSHSSLGAFTSHPPGGVEVENLPSIEHSGGEIDSNNETFSLQITIRSLDIDCARNCDVIGRDLSDSTRWRYLIDFGRREVIRWATRQFVVEFSFQEIGPYGPFIYYTEMEMNEMVERGLFDEWVLKNRCNLKPNSVPYFHLGSPDRPEPEPIYCAMTGSDQCPRGYQCLQAGANPDQGYTGFDHFFLAFLTSFRLVSLDAWGRLYYLTLHTSGPAYAIFYILVVFLGSYYLVNLILAVVYMAYEEQQAAVDEEVCAAKEREQEDRDMQMLSSSYDSGASSYVEDSSNMTDSDCDVKMGLITTSLGPHTNHVTRGSFRLRHKRKLLRQRSYSNVMTSPEFDEGCHDNSRKDSRPLKRLQMRPDRSGNGHFRVYDVMIDSIEQINEEDESASQCGRVPREDGKRRKFSAPSSMRHWMDINIRHASRRRKVSFPVNNSVPSYGLEQCNVDHDDRLLPIIRPPRRLSESSSDDDNSEVKHLTIEVDVETNRAELMENDPDPRSQSISDQPPFNRQSSFSKRQHKPRHEPRGSNERNFPQGFGRAEACSKRRNVVKRSRRHLLSNYLINVFAKWRCLPSPFQNLQSRVRELVLNPFTDVFITICIALNGLFLAVEQHPMDQTFRTNLERANLFFTIVFTVEMLGKIVGLTPYTYFRQRWNVFDAIVVLFSLLEYFVETTGGFSILRAFRLMRIVKLAKQWPILNKLLRIIGRTLGKLWHLTLVFLLVLYIFAVVGMQLFHKSYHEKFEDYLPRWNFIDFPHAFMVVFRIQCGEWVENMFICLSVASPGLCIPFFVSVYIIGNLVILNLFLALLLNSFSGDVLQQTNSDNNSISEAIKRTKRWMKRQKTRISAFSEELLRRLKTHSKSLASPFPPPITSLELSSLRSKTSCDLISPSIHQEDDAENHSPAFHKQCSYLEVHSNLRNYSRSLHHIGGMRTSRSCSIHSRTSGWSSHSAPTRHYRRSQRDVTRRARALARSRYRGMSSSLDVEGHPNMSGSQSIEARSKSEMEEVSEDVPPVAADRGEAHGGSVSVFGAMPMSRERTSQNDSNEESKESETQKKHMEPCIPCIPECYFDRGCFLSIRRFAFKVVEHKHFENVVIFCILLSSVALAMEDIYLSSKPALARVVNCIELFCCAFFTLEMLVKWVGLGWKKYFTNCWCLLDCAIVLISIVNLSVASAAHAHWSAFRALRTFRALRPLRALSRFKGMKVVVDALLRAIPPILNVFVVCIVTWLIFGKFLPPTNLSLTEQCSPDNILLAQYLQGEVALSKADLSRVLPAVRNKEECIQCATMLNNSVIEWNVPHVNFDSVPKAYLALLQLATFNGWVEIMASAVDVTGVEEQPHYEASFFNYVYFCVFVIFGSFFSLNLFIGVIIDNFNQQKIKQKGAEDGVFLTDEQRQYYNAMKKMASKTPKKPIPRPNNRLANKVYDVVTDRKFEIGVMVLIMLNLVVMAVEHYGMPHQLDSLLSNFNLAFICIFMAEAVLKLIGLRFYYFTIPWNVFDILVITVSLVATGLSDVMSQYFVQPTLFRIIRLFRVTRILRLIREAKGIRTLLFALMMSLPALFNIGSLLFLLMSIYAIIGMSQFPYIQKTSGIDNILNFETFPNSFLILFQISTSEGWDKFIEPVLLDHSPHCDPHPEDGSPSNCGNGTVGTLFFVTYVIISFLIVVNMYIAVILENFEVATRENAEPLTADDFEQFFEVWQRYDDRLTQYISYDQLQQLLHELDHPLRVPLPNKAFIATSQLRISIDGKIHCLEVVVALIKKVLGDSPELKELKGSMMESFFRGYRLQDDTDEGTIGSDEYTVWLKAATIIQRSYRDYRLCNYVCCIFILSYHEKATEALDAT